MNKVIILKGLPASGKTTYAKELVKAGCKRVNKDLLREMLDFGVYSEENEKLICEIRDMIIDLSLINGFDIVVDDTNFSKKHFNKIAMIADINDASVEVVNMHATLDECIERDRNRENPVGEDVIRSMYEKYIEPQKSQNNNNGNK